MPVYPVNSPVYATLKLVFLASVKSFAKDILRLAIGAMIFNMIFQNVATFMPVSRVHRRCLFTIVLMGIEGFCAKLVTKISITRPSPNAHHVKACGLRSSN